MTEERNAVFRRIERELEEADEIVCILSQLSSREERLIPLLNVQQIAQMDIEAQTADHHEKASLQAKLREHKAKVNKQRADLVSSPSVSLCHSRLTMITY